MDSLVGYGSDDDNETERPTGHRTSGYGGSGGAPRRRDDDTNYDDVNMDMSEDSQEESEPELPPAEPTPSRHSRDERRGSDESRPRDRSRGGAREHERRDKRRDSPPPRHHTDSRSQRSADKYRFDKERAERGRGCDSGSKRGLLGDRPDDRAPDKVPALMDLKPFGGEPPPGAALPARARRDRSSHDARDAVSPRFTDRGDRRDRDRSDRDRGDRERGRERERHNRRSEERWSGGKSSEYRSRSRGAAFPPPTASTSSAMSERRGSPPSGDYRPSSYKVNKKLEVMEKMGLQIKTPDGSMATAQQLRAAASDTPAAPRAALPGYYNPGALNSAKIMDQVQKRKLLWSNKGKSEAEEAAKWSGTRFASDQDGKQVSKFMRLMGIKEPGAVKPESTDKTADPIKKQEELFSAMQAQYEVARATTHTMRGVGLGFQRGQF